LAWFRQVFVSRVDFAFAGEVKVIFVFMFLKCFKGNLKKIIFFKLIFFYNFKSYVDVKNIKKKQKNIILIYF